MDREQLFNNIYIYVILLSMFEFGIGIYESYILSINVPDKYNFTDLQQIAYAFVFYKCVLNNICAFMNLVGLCSILCCSFGDIFSICLFRVGQFVLSLYGLNLCFSYDIDKLEPFSDVVGYEALLFSSTIVIGLCKYVKIKYLD